MNIVMLAQIPLARRRLNLDLDLTCFRAEQDSAVQTIWLSSDIFDGLLEGVKPWHP